MILPEFKHDFSKTSSKNGENGTSGTDVLCLLFTFIVFKVHHILKKICSYKKMHAKECSHWVDIKHGVMNSLQLACTRQPVWPSCEHPSPLEIRYRRNQHRWRIHVPIRTTFSISGRFQCHSYRQSNEKKTETTWMKAALNLNYPRENIP